MRHAALGLIIPILLVLFAAVPAEAGVNWWTPVGPEGGFVSSLAFDPATRTVYAGTGGGVFVSTNGGGSWERRSRGLRGGVTHLVAASVPTPIVYAVGGFSLYRSTDRGASWTTLIESQFGGLEVKTLAVDPADSSTVYVGTYRHGIWKSSDGGARWKQVFGSDSCGAIYSLAISPRSPSTIYAGCGSDLQAPFFKSTNGGATWTPKGSSLPDGGEFVHLALDPSRPHALYLTATMDVEGSSDWVTFKSTDDGATWTRFSAQGALLEVSPSGVLFIGKYRSRDGGSSWEELPVFVWPYAKTFDPLDPSVVYASFFSTGDFMSSGVYKSTDEGTTWSPINRGLFATGVFDLAIDPQSTLFALTFGNGLLKGSKGGARWEHADAGLLIYTSVADAGVPALAIDPVDPENLYLGGTAGFGRSTDGGSTWTVLPALAGRCMLISDLVVDPRFPRRLFAAGELFDGSCDGVRENVCSVFRSDDTGATWTCAGPPSWPATRIVFDPVQPSRLYALTYERIWVSTDRGSNWRALRNPRGVTGFLSFAVDPKDPRRLYAGTNYGLYKSTDRGATWSAASKGLSFDTIWKIVIDPTRPQTVYAAGAFGVYLTANGGRAWHPLNGGLPTGVRELLLDPRNPRKLYAATYGSGIYVHERR